MKTIKKIIFGILGLLAVLSCNKDNNSYAPVNQKVFVPELFLSSIESQISDAIGYAIIVNKDGSIAASSAEGVGYIDPAEGSNVPTTINQDINIASVTYGK